MKINNLRLILIQSLARITSIGLLLGASGCLPTSTFQTITLNTSSFSSDGTASPDPLPPNIPNPTATPAPTGTPAATPSESQTGYQFPTSKRIASTGKLDLVSTFEATGVYFTTQNGSANEQALVRYRRLGTSIWIEGQPLWFDVRSANPADLYRAPAGFSRQYRGSIIGLQSGSTYEIETLLIPSGEFISGRVSTWKDDLPISKTVEISSNSNVPLVISESGTANGYILYRAKPGSKPVIDVARSHDSNVVVKGSYIIVRGLTLRNSAKHGIVVSPESHDVVIEKNDISGWGRIAPDADSQRNGWGMNLDSAVSTEGKANSKVTRLVIQDNLMHDPIATSNNWDQKRQDYDEFEQPRFSNGQPLLNPHPIGPQGISLTSTAGNHVIRYNRIYSSDPVNGTKFNDGIGGGGSNFTTGGAPGRDSDIYGNEISDAWDDGIESEGGNTNVRVWNNYIHHTYMSIAISPVAVGPMYIFRNVAGHTRRTPTDAKGGNFIKGQSRIQTKKIRDPQDPSKTINAPDFIAGGGRVFVYHNTTVGLVNVGISRSNEQLLNYVTRNNILQGKETAIQGQLPLAGALPNVSPKFDRSNSGIYRNDFDHDLYSPGISLTESLDGVVSPVQFVYEDGNQSRGYRGIASFSSSGSAGSYALTPGSIGHDKGINLPGFNAVFSGSAPDIGAQENGATPLRFGPRN